MRFHDAYLLKKNAMGQQLFYRTSNFCPPFFNPLLSPQETVYLPGLVDLAY